ncbi:MAG: MFS transporter [Pseudomonadota bacterium]
MNWGFMTSDKKFAPFFWTQFWGAFNDNFFKNALVVLVAFRGVQLLGLDSGALIAAAGGLFILPFFLFSPLAGQLCDKYEKSRVIRATKVLEIVIMLLAALGFLLQNYLILLFLLFLMGTQSAFFGPAKYSIIPDIVSEKRLTEATAFIELGTFLSILLGTIAGGLITSVSGADLWIGLGLIAFAVIGYWTSRGVPATPIGAPQLKITYNPFPEYLSLWRIIASKPSIFYSVFAISWFWFFGAGVLSVLPIYVKDYLMGTEGVVTLFLAMFTVGVGIGSMLCEKMSRGEAEIGVVPIGAVGMTLFFLDIYWVGMPWEEAVAGSVSVPQFFSSFNGIRLTVDFILMAVFGGIFIVPLYTLLQERSEASLRSRVIAANNVFSAFFMVLASILVLVFYQIPLNPVEIFATFSIMNLVVTFAIFARVPEFFNRFVAWLR